MKKDCSKHKKAGKCTADGCVNTKAAHGKCPKCGKGLYRAYCRRNTCPRKKEYIIANHKDAQTQVILNPKNSHYSFDCVRIKLTDQDGNLQIVDMTPDEALELGGLISAAVSIWLLQNKEYAKFIKREDKPHGKKTL